MTIGLAVIVPTLNEKDNVSPLYDALASALEGTSWEVVFADGGSTDGTAEVLMALAATKPNARCLNLEGARGLAADCVSGMKTATAPYLAVMDADFQHDASLLAPMLRALQDDGLDLVVGSRYMAGSSSGGLSRLRLVSSRGAGLVSRLVLPIPLTDPMSGFFALRRDLFEEVEPYLVGAGFKILLDIVTAAQRPLKWRELPYRFRTRRSGDSKLNASVAGDFFRLLLAKLARRWG